ncbi:zinc ribbon domain-containing protein [Natronoglomus mannanivorans]|uniref:Zinc ribbon domain-containing protein n=1 Tax=Natronoglomus mannanivorans TaxID=2979990 RepID=A0AAP2Z2S6_9EURY|nr:zinc ribbon domain-containing protein [Halobacteria archaeon AArc-xg1-1]
MNYCSECGTELVDDPNFCPECGEPIAKRQAQSQGKRNQTGSQVIRRQTDFQDKGRQTDSREQVAERPQDPGEQETTESVDRIAIDTGPGAQRFYNLNNLSYFQNLTFEYTLLAKGLFGVAGLVILWIGLEIDSTPFLTAGGIAIWAIWNRFSPEDGVAIGTVADRDMIETDDPDTVEHEFVEKTSGKISVRGAIQSSFYQLNYVYHFLDQNVISVERFDSIDKRRSLLLITSGVAIVLLSVLLVDPNPSDSTITIAVAIGIFGNLVIGAGGTYASTGVQEIKGALTSQQRIVFVYGLSSTTFFLLLPIFTLYNTYDALGSRYTLTMDLYESVQFSATYSIVAAIILCGLILLTPGSGALISLPSDEQVHFTMSDEDVEEVIGRFLE